MTLIVFVHRHDLRMLAQVGLHKVFKNQKENQNSKVRVLTTSQPRLLFYKFESSAFTSMPSSCYAK